MSRTRRRIGLVLVAALSLVLAACDPPEPQDDGFYTDAADLSGAPGDVIRSRPSTFTLDPIGHLEVPGVQSWQVLYRSTTALGAPTAVSGTVLVPTTPWLGLGRRPLVSYAPGTRGVGDACAPSYTLTQGADYEGFFIKALLDQGWAVAVTDYEGLGTPGDHTYVVGRSEGRAVIDIARAAQRLPGTGLSSSTPTAFMGYSQGGGAAGWAGELAPSYGQGLDVKAVVAGGIPGDLTAVADFNEDNIGMAVVLLAALGLDTAYPELDLDAYLDARGQELRAEADDLCLVSVEAIPTLFGTVFTNVDDFTHTNPLETPQWQARLEENRLGRARPRVPVYQYHGIVDELVPYGQARTLRRNWCNQGANVTWTSMPGEHALTLVEAQAPAIAWLHARFLGVPTLGNCWLP